MFTLVNCQLMTSTFRLGKARTSIECLWVVSLLVKISKLTQDVGLLSQQLGINLFNECSIFLLGSELKMIIF